MKVCEPAAPRPAGDRPISRPARSRTNENSPTCASISAVAIATGRAAPRASTPDAGGSNFHQEHGRDSGQNQRQVRGQEPHVEQHANRDEERGAEEDLQRQDLAERVLTEAALAHDQAGEECAEGQADAGQIGQERGAEADCDDRQQEQLRRAGARHLLENERHQPARDQQDGGDDQRRPWRAPIRSPAPSRRCRPASGPAAPSPRPRGPGRSGCRGRAARACCAVSLRSARSFNTIAVELRATRKPLNSPLRQSTPKTARSAIVPSVASTTCRPPPAKIACFISASLPRLNSMPMVKSRNITPTSAVASTSAGSCTRPSACGPMTTPATRNPTIGISPRRKQSRRSRHRPAARRLRR